MSANYTKEDITDLSRVAVNLRLGKDGLWHHSDHRDLKFLENDETDWNSIEPNSFWYQHRNRCFTTFFRLFPPQGIVVEIGAGNGSVALVLQNAGLSVVAIEPTVKSARSAKQRGVRHVICADFEEVQLNTSLDINIGLFDVLEHIKNDDDFLRVVRNRLPKGGRLYCAVPAFQMLWSCEDVISGHYRRYTLETLSAKMRTAGFTVEYGTYYFHPLWLPIFLLRTIPTFLGVRRKRTHSSMRREHQLRISWITRLVGWFLDREITALEHRKKYSMGASCFVVTHTID